MPRRASVDMMLHARTPVTHELLMITLEPRAPAAMMLSYARVTAAARCHDAQPYAATPFYLRR